jgi:formate-dependent nitrite reductase membrane component NrfD
MSKALLDNRSGDKAVSAHSKNSAHPKWMGWTGWGMTGLMILFLLFDGLSKLALERHVVEATTKIGYPLDTIRPLGIICLVCTILLTGYLGGAIASKVRIEDPLFSSVLFGVYFGIFVWGGLYLRDERVRSLIPLQR